jgi:protein-tyrosine phosphatase
LERGVLVQLTGGSVTSDRDWRAHRAAVTMLRQGLVHIIASDAHKPYRRRPILSLARAAAAQIIGLEQADALVNANPQAVLENRLIPASTIRLV